MIRRRKTKVEELKKRCVYGWEAKLVEGMINFAESKSGMIT